MQGRRREKPSCCATGFPRARGRKCPECGRIPRTAPVGARRDDRLTTTTTTKMAKSSRSPRPKPRMHMQAESFKCLNKVFLVSAESPKGKDRRPVSTPRGDARAVAASTATERQGETRGEGERSGGSSHADQFQILRKLSHDPVAIAMPSSVTPRQLTRLSCPANTPARSCLSVSQTLQLKSS